MASPHAAAHGFSQQALERKLQNLSSTLQNIQIMAQWSIHYRKHAKTITTVWYKELQKGEKLRLRVACNVALGVQMYCIYLYTVCSASTVVRLDLCE